MCGSVNSAYLGRDVDWDTHGGDEVEVWKSLEAERGNEGATLNNLKK